MTTTEEKMKKVQDRIERQKKKRRKRRFQRNMHVFLIIVLCIAGLVFLKHPGLSRRVWPFRKAVHKKKDNTAKKEKPGEVPARKKPDPAQDPIAQAVQNAKAAGVPESIIKLLKKNPETLSFVKDYPEKKDSPYFDKPLPLPEDGSYPHYLQFDERWGYMPYAGGVMANSGCGPTTCAMMASRLLNDPALTPSYMAKYAKDNGFMSEDDGTYGGFMKEGMQSLGIKVSEGKTGKETTFKHLEEGRPIICLMRPGVFTDTGHYILLTGVQDGKIKIKDPFSTSRTDKLWTFKELDPEISLMWCYSK